MDTTRISLARVLELGVRVSWHEAVAITLQVASDTTGAGPRSSKPFKVDTLSCLLTRGGDVEITDSPTAEPSSLNAFFLELLIDPDAPPELVRRARTGGPDSLADDLEVVANAPKRRRVEIASVAIRALSAEAELARRTVDTLRGLPVEPELPPVVNAAGKVVPADEQDAEFNRLRAQVGNGEGGDVGRRRSFRRSVDLRLVGGIGVPAALGLAWWLWSPGLPSAPPPPRMFAIPRPLRAVGLDPKWAAIDRSPVILPPPRASSSASPPPDDPESTPPPGEQAAEAGIGATTPPPVVEIAPTAPPSSTPPAPPPAAPPVPRARPAPEPLDSTIYSAANAGVEPPVLRYPNLPNAVLTASSAPISGPYFEVLVDQVGRVETVRLRGRVDQSETYYRHRMMLAAAKAWRFAPARRDGRPVRYSARVVIRP